MIGKNPTQQVTLFYYQLSGKRNWKFQTENYFLEFFFARGLVLIIFWLLLNSHSSGQWVDICGKSP